MKFPYIGYAVNENPLIPDGVVFAPEVPVTVIGPAGDAIVLALVDTGGEFTLFPESVAHQIGATVEVDRGFHVTGFPGGTESMVAYPGIVELELHRDGESLRWQTVVGFAPFEENRYSARGVLGHAGCLEFFRSSFDGMRRELELIPNAKLPTSDPRD